MTEISHTEYGQVATMVEKEGLTLEEALAKVRNQQSPVSEKPKRAKYGNVKTEVDGFTFDSKREADRYQELKARADRGDIARLTIQPRFPLHALRARSNTFVEIGSYVADFSYQVVATGETVIEDVKGVKTELYKWKKRHVESQYGIEIVEVQ